MKVVVADATPLHYLILVHAIDVLPCLFERISIPLEVSEELTRPASPALVRSWIENPPPWLDFLSVNVTHVTDPALTELDPGERLPLSNGD